LSTQDLNAILDTLTCLTLIAHTIINRIGTEFSQFNAFSTWLRHEIDAQAADPSSVSIEDVTEKESMIEHSKVLAYIQGPLKTSKIAAFFRQNSTQTSPHEWDFADTKGGIYQPLLGELKKHTLSVSHSQSVPRLEDLSKYLNEQCAAVFNQIAESDRRNVLFGEPVALQIDSASSVADMKMNFEVKPARLNAFDMC
jgi:anaphase-promoting complex subunit 4